MSDGGFFFFRHGRDPRPTRSTSSPQQHPSIASEADASANLPDPGKVVPPIRWHAAPRFLTGANERASAWKRLPLLAPLPGDLHAQRPQHQKIVQGHRDHIRRHASNAAVGTSRTPHRSLHPARTPRTRSAGARAARRARHRGAATPDRPPRYGQNITAHPNCRRTGPERAPLQREPPQLRRSRRLPAPGQGRHTRVHQDPRRHLGRGRGDLRRDLPLPPRHPEQTLSHHPRAESTRAPTVQPALPLVGYEPARHR